MRVEVTIADRGRRQLPGLLGSYATPQLLALDPDDGAELVGFSGACEGSV